MDGGSQANIIRDYVVRCRASRESMRCLWATIPNIFVSKDVVARFLKTWKTNGSDENTRKWQDPRNDKTTRSEFGLGFKVEE
ncbi:hypothetical protein Clacol_005378 [Clathrus columnatus]|uniref:Uncharacterized protein n=1 Tax=Clathrus columnatus TaxID=1419009 RepID=A0AAV5A948_9AGAM|nr:hypothetical protein Clacol_005378 [Clathrus columnatus]